MHRSFITYKVVRRKLRRLQINAIENGLTVSLLRDYYITTSNQENKKAKRCFIIGIVTVLVFLVISGSWLYTALSERCLVPSNYLVWEATRPLADCCYCENVTKPIVLWNVTRRGFAVRTIYEYSNKLILTVHFNIDYITLQRNYKTYLWTANLSLRYFFLEICLFFKADHC